MQIAGQCEPYTPYKTDSSSSPTLAPSVATMMRAPAAVARYEVGKISEPYAASTTLTPSRAKVISTQVGMMTIPGAV